MAIFHFEKPLVNYCLTFSQKGPLVFVNVPKLELQLKTGINRFVSEKTRRNMIVQWLSLVKINPYQLLQDKSVLSTFKTRSASKNVLF